MTKFSQSYASRSHALLLLEQQKYEEALTILADLREKDPSDREIRIYYLLLLRIFVLRWSLSRAMAERPRRLTSVMHVFDRLKRIRCFARSYQPAEILSTNRSTRRFITAAAGSGFLIILLAFNIIGGGRGESPVLTSTDTAPLTVSVKDAKTFDSNKPRTADEDHRQSQLQREAEKRDLPRVVVEPSKLLPVHSSQDVLKSHLRFGEQEFTSIGKATPLVDVSNDAIKRHGHRAALKIERKNIGNKALLGRYQSRWAIPIRKFPRFAAATVQEIDRGVPVNVLELNGSWAKVQLGPAGVTGFIRREFLISAKETEAKLSQISPSMKRTPNTTVFSSRSTS